jgi:ferredoxin
MMVPPDKRDETAPVDEAIAVLDAVLLGLGHQASGRVALLSEDDPDALDEKLYGLAGIGAVGRAAFSAVEGKREMARLAFSVFRETAPSPIENIELPAGAPYGRIVVDSAACTLCLSCVGACPANALSDHPDRPQLGFTEQACVQCGVCVSTCPEKAIRLEARYSFAAGAASPAVMKSEDPFECVRCGKAFGTKSSIERVLDRLKGHAMFRDERQLEVLQMCEDCRVIAVAERAPDPMRMGTRPRIMTTDDYIEAEQKARSSGRKPEDFIDD